MRRCWFFTVLALSGLTALAAAPWPQSLYLGNGGLWQRRVEVQIRNDSDQPAVGEPVILRVGVADGEAELAGATVDALRLCDAKGTEMLYAVLGPDGQSVIRGPVPPGATVILPAECPAAGTATYYLYFENPDAWPVPDFLNGVGALRNGGLEQGEGDTPFAWQHDVNDVQHRTFWVGENPHAGAKSLKTAVSDGAEPTWIATRQHALYVTARASKPEALDVREVGADAPWWDDDPQDQLTWDYRVPLRVVNLSDSPLEAVHGRIPGVPRWHQARAVAAVQGRAGGSGLRSL
ncbi:MAG: hypothetical protein A3K19_33060 [Lentisphaerae bacterium RIFOXYB12_FULL_65_16]|nr:MAG: hypothetical protein A3K18_31695 [Lentisphaerae bacterium RIFOXYA12_64_32]OGV87017.1 MAG: hypothetical protein A3K19_33060 [Lentisphaerae bacterium RIFOXYB12_FULL_65_16]